MSDIKKSNQVYQVRQGDFGAIPGSPWVYWVSRDIISLFHNEDFPPLRNLFTIDMGLKTSGNERFVRWWWEIGTNIKFDANGRQDALQSKMKWFPYAKGAAKNRWGSRVWNCVNWRKDGDELKTYLLERYPYLKGNPAWCTHNEDLYFRSAIIWKTISTNRFIASLIPKGTIISNSNYGIFSPEDTSLDLLAFLNSSVANYLFLFLSPTINFNQGEVENLPICLSESKEAISLAGLCFMLANLDYHFVDESPTFIVPQFLMKENSYDTQVGISERINNVHSKINKIYFDTYHISNTDRLSIIKELGESPVLDFDYENKYEDDDDDDFANPINEKEINFSWLSYAIGIILRRFQPGTPGALGSAIYRRTDFAIDSLPEPTEEEFNELVGDPSQFAYIDEQDGRHVFSREVEQALQKLAIPDGIAVFDPNHPRDLPTLVGKALELMLGQAQAQEVIQQAAGGDLRKFLEKDFFTQHHIKQYRKRPVYWPIQSSKRSYGFVLFHEKIDRNTFYALQQEPYLPTKRRAVQLRLEEFGKKVLTAQGAARKPIEKEMDELRQLAEELAQFAKDLEAVTRGGYEPEADWIDDGVILRMAPLWSVIPLWKSEPKKYWDELAAGKYDWSRIAMKYWPERVMQACKKNKSYAIAHGHEEWFIGN